MIEIKTADDKVAAFDKLVAAFKDQYLKTGLDLENAKNPIEVTAALGLRLGLLDMVEHAGLADSEKCHLASLQFTIEASQKVLELEIQEKMKQKE